MFTKARWDKSFIFNSIRLRREWLWEALEAPADAVQEDTNCVAESACDNPAIGAGDDGGQLV